MPLMTDQQEKKRQSGVRIDGSDRRRLAALAAGEAQVAQQRVAAAQAIVAAPDTNGQVAAATASTEAALAATSEVTATTGATARATVDAPTSLHRVYRRG